MTSCHVPSAFCNATVKRYAAGRAKTRRRELTRQRLSKSTCHQASPFASSAAPNLQRALAARMEQGAQEWTSKDAAATILPADYS